MNYFAGSTNNQWSTANPETEARTDLSRFLGQVLTSENLVVLTGLGTSRAVQGADGNSPAPTMADLWELVRLNVGEEFHRIVQALHHPAGDENIEALLSRAQMAQSLDPSENIAAFIARAEETVCTACRFVDAGTNLTTHRTFLQKVARRSTRQPRAKIFTTNYDLCFERAADLANFIVVDGFSHAVPQVFDGDWFAYDFVRRIQDKETPDYLPNVVHLYKLHGSIDWEEAGNIVRKRDGTSRPRIIYPRESKFASSFDPPFLELMSRFQIALRQPNTGLLIVGFGFNDAHITHPLLSSLRSNVSLKALIVDPNLQVSCDSKAVLGDLRDLIRAGDFRLAMLAATFEELVPVLPDLVAVTEEERHRDRLRAVGVTA